MTLSKRLQRDLLAALATSAEEEWGEEIAQQLSYTARRMTSALKNEAVRPTQ